MDANDSDSMNKSFLLISFIMLTVNIVFALLFNRFNNRKIRSPLTAVLLIIGIDLLLTFGLVKVLNVIYQYVLMVGDK